MRHKGVNFLDKQRVKFIKQHLEWNKAFKTKTNDGWKPSVVGEYTNEDVEFLINTVEAQQELIETLKVKIEEAYQIGFERGEKQNDSSRTE